MEMWKKEANFGGVTAFAWGHHDGRITKRGRHICRVGDKTRS